MVTTYGIGSAADANPRTDKWSNARDSISLDDTNAARAIATR